MFYMPHDVKLYSFIKLISSSACNVYWQDFQTNYDIFGEKFRALKLNGA